ncbi:MAG: HlyC/CorC family transporter [Acholeplasmataceae bacterium]|nr:MAG: HlyC/CorC family transporter [Acholeplasmataceae bacterium]
MNPEDLTLIIVLAVLVLVSGFFSATETAFSSVNKIKLKNRVQNGSKAAARTLHLAERFDRVLITILIGNNIVNIAAASLATVFFVKNWGDIGVTLATVVMTTAILIFGEITPKSLAKEIPEKFAIVVTPVLFFLIWVLTPLGVVFAFWQRLMNRLFRFKKEATVTEEELLTYVDEAKQEGEINENERQLIKSVIDFDERKIEEIFTPRVDVIAVSLEHDTDAVTKAFKTSGFSRLPVYDEDIDHVIGLINHKDFYHDVLVDKKPLEAIISPVVNVTEYMRIRDLLSLLKQNKAHMAIVKDEFGGTLGVVTMEDILEELVGEIWDEHDDIIEHMAKVAPDTYKVKGNADLEEFFEQVGIKDEVNHVTVNGWVLETIGHIPAHGEHFEYKHLSVTILNADLKKVLEILVKLSPIEEDED